MLWQPQKKNKRKAPVSLKKVFILLNYNLKQRAETNKLAVKKQIASNIRYDTNLMGSFIISIFNN